MTGSSPVGHRALEGVRVLDLGGEISNYCGRMFAQLGAEVILVEPVAGSSYRMSLPQAARSGDSLRFAYDNADKRSIGVDLATEEGREVLRRLASTADLLLDDRTEHSLAQHGLDYELLLQEFPDLIATAITPFGLDGPYADFVATDATCLAFGGMLWLGGYDDGPPVQAAGRQAFRAGSLFGAVASMSALVAPERHRGELIDVSVQECVSLGLENAVQFYDLEGRVRRRHGGQQKQAGFGAFPCADGYVFLIAGGIGGNRFWQHFVDWMKSEGVEGAESLEESRWWDRPYVEGDEAKSRFWDLFTGYAMTRSKKQLLESAMRWNVPLSPVMTVAEVHGSAQLRERGFFVQTEVGGAVADTAGPPYQLSETPWHSARPAPQLGEQTAEIMRELGFTPAETADWKVRGAIA